MAHPLGGFLSVLTDGIPPKGWATDGFSKRVVEGGVNGGWDELRVCGIANILFSMESSLVWTLAIKMGSKTL